MKKILFVFVGVVLFSCTSFSPRTLENPGIDEHKKLKDLSAEERKLLAELVLQESEPFVCDFTIPFHTGLGGKNKEDCLKQLDQCNNIVAGPIMSDWVVDCKDSTVKLFTACEIQKLQFYSSFTKQYSCSNIPTKNEAQKYDISFDTVGATGACKRHLDACRKIE